MLNQKYSIEPIREFLKELMQDSGAKADFSDGQSLILSRVLDSLSVMKLIIFLEQEYQISLDSFAYDISDIDSLEKIEKFLKANMSQQ